MTAPLRLPAAPEPRASRPAVVLAATGLVLAALAAYANSFAGSFVFDDLLSIPQNPTIRHFATALSPPGGGVTVAGRPVLSLSFALNYAISGYRVWSYHAVNLLIHALAGLTLFGIVRRTLAGLATDRGQARGMARGTGGEETLIAFSVALLWLVHPLQTESVTYIVQRAESLMGLFYLLTLSCFIRGGEGMERCRGSRGWFALAIGSCLLGVGTKEVIVTAPVIVLLYDRTFLAGSFREAWRRRGWVHLSLAATWLPLAGLVVHGANRGGSAGFGVTPSFLAHLATQFQAVAYYLWLSIWPHPLILDYGAQLPTSAWDVAPYAVVIAALVAGTALALVRSPALGFLGVWFFAILALTSVVALSRQTLAEHRMYLSLAPVMVLLVLALRAWLGPRIWPVAVAVAAIGFAGLTIARNADYRSNATMLRDTVAKRPGNPEAQNNLGNVLAHSNKVQAALERYEEALRLDPGYADAHYNAGKALERLGRLPEAIAQYEEAVRLEPNFAVAHGALGIALCVTGRRHEGIEHLERAVQIDPAEPVPHRSLGNALRADGRLADALAQYEEALRLAPDSAQFHCDLGNALREADRLPEAIEQYKQAVRIDPAQPGMHNDLGIVELMAGRTQDAVTEFEEALRLDPRLAQVHLNLAAALASAGRNDEAAAHTEAARRLGANIPVPQN
jgi:tetratricopeptide (TPR) repeat protein